MHDTIAAGEESVNELIARIEDARAGQIVRNNIYGIDINEQAVGLARLSLFLLTASTNDRLPDLSRRIVAGDSVKSADFDWTTAFPEVATGDNPGFDIIIGNPPYVRQEDLVEKERMQVPGYDGVSNEVDIPSKSDLSSYFYYHSFHRLKRDGMLGFITSDSWMNHDYGLKLQDVMLNECHITTLMRTKFNVFRDADVKTITVILKKEKGSDGTVKILQADKETDLQVEPRGAEKRQDELGPGNWNLLFVRPEPEPRIPMIKLAEMGNLRRGITTGHNDFFVLKSDTIGEYGIADEYLSPVVSGSIHEGLLEDGDAEEYLLNVCNTKGRLVKTANGRNVLRYIEAGENTQVTPKKGKDRTARKISELDSVRNRRIWYSLDLGDPPSMFLGRFADRRMKMYENNGRFHARDNFAYFTPHNTSYIQAFLAYFASSWFSLYMEKNGHAAGGGALQMIMRDYAKAPVPDFARMPDVDVERLKTAWMSYRDDFDRNRLDNAVYGVLGIKSSERSAIESELDELAERRLNSKQGSRTIRATNL